MSDRDDEMEDTWRKRDRPRSHWDDAQRAQVGAAHRDRRSSPLGVPTVPDRRGWVDGPEDVTSPLELLERDLDEESQAQFERSRRDSSEPATFGQLINLAVELTKVKRNERASRAADEKRIDQLLDLLERKPDDEVEALRAEIDRLRADLSDVRRVAASHERAISPLRRIAKWAAGAAGAAVITVGTFLYTRGVSEGAEQTRIQQLERSFEQLQHFIFSSDNSKGHQP